MKSYKDIVKRSVDLGGMQIENNMIDSIEVVVVGHFGNIVTLAMFFTNCCLFSQYNLGGYLGDVLKVIVEVLDLTDDDGVCVSKIKNVPVRIVSKSGCGSKVIGFGHFMKDRFVLVEDVIGLAKANCLERVSGVAK